MIRLCNCPISTAVYAPIRYRELQRGRVARVSDLKSVDCGFKSRSDRLLMLFSVDPSSASRLCLYIVNWSAPRKLEFLT